LEAGFHRKPNKTDALRGLFDLKQFPPKEDIFKHFGTSGAVGTVLPDGVLLTGRVPAHP
jgi:hypothetical protein